MKPDKPGELTDVHVSSISLVNKAANKKTFAIFKSAESPEPTEKGLLTIIKNYLLGDGIEKGALSDKYKAQEKAQGFHRAIEALRDVLGYGYGSDQKPETDVKKIRGALSDFQKIMEDVLIGKDDDLKKFAEEVRKSDVVEKAGRKISAARRLSLKAAYEALGKVLEETSEETAENGGDDVAKGAGEEKMDAEKLKEIVKGVFDEAIKPVTERLEKLEKGEGDDGAKKDPVEKGDEIAAIVKEAVESAIAPINERLEKVEKARGASNSIKDDDVKKNGDGGDLFDGVF